MSQPEYLVSVVIPTYDRTIFLVRAVRSVLDQTHGNVEVIVVDDHSTEDVPRALNQIKDERVRYLRNDRTRGAPGSRNTGIVAARGEYVAFLDDDDQWRGDKLEKQLYAARAADVVICGSTSCSRRLRSFRDGPVNPDNVRRGFMLEGGTSALLARTDVLKRNLFDETLGCWQDWDLLLRLITAFKVVYIAEPMVIYNNGNHARISNEPKRMSSEEREKGLVVLEKHKVFFGTHWVKRHTADLLLAYVSHREDPIREVLRTIQRTGFSHVALAIGRRFVSKVFGD